MAWATLDQLSEHLPQWPSMLLRQDLGEFLPANLADVTQRAQAILERASQEARTYCKARYALTMASWEGGTQEGGLVDAVCDLAVWKIVTVYVTPLDGNSAAHEPWRTNWKHAIQFLVAVRDGKQDLEDRLAPLFVNRARATSTGGGQVFS
jgi:phage gp36-like protein